MWSPRKLLRLPVELRVALSAAIIAFCLNLAWAAHQASWKLDPGTATLCGAIIGLAIIGRQTRRGFANLIKSQRNQSEIDREARVHQAQLSREAALMTHSNERDVLLSAMWAETTALWHKVVEAEISAETFDLVHENFERSGSPNTSRGIILQSFDAPVFKANIPNLGLLGSSLAADVISVMARADGKDKQPIDIVASNQTLITVYKGNAAMLKKWRQDLSHVAMRIASIQGGRPDPGTLVATEEQRRKGD